MKFLSGDNKLRLIYFLSYIGFNSWYPVFNLYLKKSGFTGLEIGILSSIYPLNLFFFQPIWGFNADKRGRKRVLLIALFFSFISLFFFRVSDSFYYMLLQTAILTLFVTTVHPLFDSLSFDQMGMNSQLRYSTIRVWGSIGWTFGSFLLSFIVFNRFNDYFRFASLFPFLCIIVLLTLPSNQQIQSEGSVKLKDVKALLKNRRINLFLALLFFLAIIFSGIANYYPILLNDIGLTQKQIRISIAVQGLCEIPFVFLASTIIKKFGMRRIMLLALIGTGIRLFLYGIAKNHFVALLGDSTNGIFWMLFWVGSIEYMNSLAGEKLRSTGQALLWSVFFGMGYIAGNMWIGFLYDYITIQSIFLINSALIIFLGIAAWVVIKTKKNTERTA